MAAAAARAVTFERCAEDYIGAHEREWRNAKHGAQWTSTLTTYAFPVFGSMIVGDIDTPHVLKALEPIWQSKTETATRLRQRIWDVGPDGARCTLEPTPARRTLDIVFEGKPDLEVLRSVVEQQEVGGAFVRVRWVVAEEDRHEVDRAAILRLLAGAAEARLEGRIVPVPRSRAQGISSMASLDDKVRAWAAATGVNPTPLLTCLAKSIAAPPQDIVEQALRFDQASVESDLDGERSDDRLIVHPVGAEECNHSH